VRLTEVANAAMHANLDESQTWPNNPFVGSAACLLTSRIGDAAPRTPR
jgi:hypothetical protein